MTKTRTSFELIKDGAFYAQVNAVSMRAARNHFAKGWTGKYQVLNTETGERKNVKL